MLTKLHTSTFIWIFLFLAFHRNLCDIRVSSEWHLISHSSNYTAERINGREAKGHSINFNLFNIESINDWNHFMLLRLGPCLTKPKVVEILMIIIGLWLYCNFSLQHNRNFYFWSRRLYWPLLTLTFTLLLRSLLFTHFGDTQEADYLWPSYFGITRRNITTSQIILQYMRH